MAAENLAGIEVRGALRQAIERLRGAGVPSYALAAELLLMRVLRRDRTWLYTHAESELDAEAQKIYFDLVGRRAAGEPTQHLTGKQEFWGLEFEVTPDVLIPRPETEHVVEVALEHLGQRRTSEQLRTADVGTGSGCIAVALARELPYAEIFATDVSPSALEVARRNAVRHGVSQRIKLREGNLLDCVDVDGSSFDLIVSNPPYISLADASQLPREVRDHEPRVALFAGPQGTEIYAPLIAQAAKFLLPGGTLVLEIGYGALDRVRPLLAESPAWTDIRITLDLASIPRVLSASRA